ncbi:hypothetical protein ACFXO9_09620 [Nocardia tengchongensis]|uniref:hypothetical protein n=1 Tax=Nocardia tengchongensis TaxID=2055889 RepID=UPI0036CC2727
MIDDPRLAPLGRFTSEGALTPGYGDAYLFLGGRDDVQGVLKTVLGQETLQIKLSMVDYDDELGDIVLAKMYDTRVHVQITLDRSRATEVNERKILDLDRRSSPAGFANSVVVNDYSAIHFPHTQVGLLGGQGIAFEIGLKGADGGEGRGVNLNGPSPRRLKTQPDTLLVSSNSVLMSRLSARMDVEHHAAARSGRPAAA